MKFIEQNITLPRRGSIPAFIAEGTPYAFHLAPDRKHYQVSDLALPDTLAIDFDTYRECEMAIALFCQAQESEVAE